MNRSCLLYTNFVLLFTSHSAFCQEQSFAQAVMGLKLGTLSPEAYAWRAQRCMSRQIAQSFDKKLLEREKNALYTDHLVGEPNMMRIVDSINAKIVALVAELIDQCVDDSGLSIIVEKIDSYANCTYIKEQCAAALVSDGSDQATILLPHFISLASMDVNSYIPIGGFLEKKSLLGMAICEKDVVKIICLLEKGADVNLPVRQRGDSANALQLVDEILLHANGPDRQKYEAISTILRNPPSNWGF